MLFIFKVVIHCGVIVKECFENNFPNWTRHLKMWIPLAVQNKWPKGMWVGGENSSGKGVWSTGVWSTLWKMW